MAPRRPHGKHGAKKGRKKSSWLVSPTNVNVNTTAAATASATPASGAPLVAQLLAEAQKALDSFAFASAEKFFVRALQTVTQSAVPSPVQAAYILTQLGALQLEVDNKDPAGGSHDASMADAGSASATASGDAPAHTYPSGPACFQQAVECAPQYAWEACCYLAQLSEGPEALAYYRQAMAILGHLLEHPEAAHDAGGVVPPHTPTDLQTRRATTLCAMTEIYMTDCCDLPEAEAMCEQLMTEAQAIPLPPNSPERVEVLLACASLRISQLRNDDACALIHASWQILGPAIKMHDDDDDEAAAEDGPAPSPPQPSAAPAESQLSPDDDRAVPKYDTLIAYSKVCVELGLYPYAEQVLDLLTTQNDEDEEVIYLSAMCHYWIGGGVSAVNEAGQEIRRPNVSAEERQEAWQEAYLMLKWLERLEAKHHRCHPAMLEHVAAVHKDLAASGMAFNDLPPEE
ncbi:hypothetical protein CXG81DRAFT_24037 [Caulochytrium protostelioides]|uniref:TPR-like protein n=1 Tax=Caulochytrium protostelioides TaxID=1555241 RepID=A0A4P9XD63_9FUNG|nr:hypothetical protein CXG81DRAFT_24037 [Caulochytrium protostelioides]|eukprot:RKP03382.1 hypothetical protein CXG81DRAFT_24037 [Caulochytrium protostelioides]